MAQRIGSPHQALALGIGTVFQHPMLVPTLTLAENMALGDPWWRRPARRRYAADVARLGVTVDASTRVRALSLGERQQAEILRAMLRGSRVLLLDEPTALLTPHDAERLGLLMCRLVAQGLAVVFITHKLNEALAWGDRISVLRLGRKVGEIPPARLQTLSQPQPDGKYWTGCFTAAATGNRPRQQHPRRALAMTVHRPGSQVQLRCCWSNGYRWRMRALRCATLILASPAAKSWASPVSTATGKRNWRKLWRDSGR
ncbi:ATP-binding cassette domain-containing protein [Sodalis glossinidius]|uniref:ATP-binding cassette domain-containing protein n=1 Tax=Sodalis glossinidius TaxID=63612 RepID=UPI0003259C1F|nr:ATP-binding cassette domain-containing protein [Sodalis glossinidius]